MDAQVQARADAAGRHLPFESEVMAREKEIRYSSCPRAGTDQFKRVQRLRCAIAGLLSKLPDDLKSSSEARLLNTVADRKVYNIVHLIYRAWNCEGHSKDYEFSRVSMEEHWRAGYHDARRTLRYPERGAAAACQSGWCLYVRSRRRWTRIEAGACLSASVRRRMPSFEGMNRHDVAH